MSHLKTQFDYECNQFSPVREDLARVVNYDEDGNEFITWEPIDYDKIRVENGSLKDWNLDTLLKAGINPNFPIKTGLNTRLEGIEQVQKAAAVADEILADAGKEE